MRRTVLLFSVAMLCVFAFVAARMADEGMWLLDSVNRLPLGDMKKYGLELSPDQIYRADGPSLKDAIVLLGGGTGSFVSPDGLIVTNHHVAFGAIQALSSLDNDYLKDGFWARTRELELSTSITAQIVKEIRDVTTDVLAGISDTMSADQRAKTIAARTRDIESTAKGSTDLNCRVSETFNGLKYILYVYQTLTDVRLVYAPPTSIGNFGGEVDNWMWPRHTGDFSFFRAYVAPDGKPAKYAAENVPFKPRRFLPISTHGYTDGSFAMIMGFPGRTFRYREAAGVQLAHDETLPATIALYKTRIDVIETASKDNRARQIKYASKIRGVANTYKNYLGVLEGMRKTDLLTIKRNDEQKLAAFINSRPELSAKFGTLLQDLETANAELRTVNRKSVLLTNLMNGVDLLRLGSRFRAYAAAHSIDPDGNLLEPPEKETVSLKDFVSTVHKSSDIDVDRELLTALAVRSLDFPVDHQLNVFRDVVGKTTGTEAESRLRSYIEDLYDDSQLTSEHECGHLMDKEPAKILNDPLVALAARIEEEQLSVNAITNAATTRLSRLRTLYVEAMIAWKGHGLIYPDANRSIRLTYGRVKPFKPRDAVEYQSFTTLAGVMEKERSSEPFVVPARLRELWTKKDFGRYADPTSGDVPVAFIANLDITGGNSGSPVLNGKGEFIGCAFDGNWEAVVGDYYFQDALNRTIAVDARYILFVLDKFSGAENIMKELTIH
jgi:hypothetical protein